MPVSKIREDVPLPEGITVAQAEYLQNNRGAELELLAENTGLTQDEVLHFLQVAPPKHSLFIKKEGVTIMTKASSERGDRR